MTRKLYIDGRDAFGEFGVFVAEGGYEQLAAFAPLKKVKSIDWQEEDGIDADLAEPVLDTREFTMKFCLAGARDRSRAFLALLSDGAYHTFDCRESLGSTSGNPVRPNPTNEGQTAPLPLQNGDWAGATL